MIAQLTAQSSDATFILVHGGWHGAWCWYKVLPQMKDYGLKVLPIDLPGHGKDTTPAASVTMDDYVNKVGEVANTINGKVILLGHSSAGTVIAQAAEQITPQKISALIFLDAFMPQQGESGFSLVEKFSGESKKGTGSTLLESMVFSPDQKTSTLKLERVKELLYHDCADEDVNLAKLKLGPQSIAPQAPPVNLTDKNYGSIPKYYIICTEARDMDKSKISTNVPTKRIYSLKSSHSPFFSMPDELTLILVEIQKEQSNQSLQK
ncbi:MAG: alpha/beta fold hydrolase [Chitinophagaceae bacterium]|nr:MAG: alpha/beta fold hydrolase [Chitinophagaceae bacterium]